MTTTQPASFDPPPISQAMVGAGGALSSSQQAAQTVSRSWALWFNAIYRRFFTVKIALRIVTGNAAIGQADGTVVANVQAASIFTLLDATLVQGQIFYLKNSAGSTSTVSLLAALAQTVDLGPASSIVINPGQCFQLQSDGSNWITV